MMRLQRCTACGRSQYPPRDFCGHCLGDRLDQDTADSLPAQVIATTTLHHSNEPRFRPHLPLRLGLVRFDTGPVAVCFLPAGASAGETVQVRLNADALLEAQDPARAADPGTP
jgi:uncharacterized OB-fold protein